MSEGNHCSFQQKNSPLIKYIFSFLHDTPCKNKKDLDPIFYVKNVNMPIDKYIERLIQYMEIDEAGIVSVTIYLDIIKNEYNINYNTIQKLFGSLLLLYIKMYYDIFHSNVHYSFVIGVSRDIIDKTEILCLEMLNWKLYIDKRIYDEANVKLKWNINKKIL